MNFSQGKYPGNITIQKKTRMPNFLSGQAPTKTEDNLEGIIQLFSSNYKNILPNKFDVNFDFNSMVFVFSKEQIIELLYQMDTLVQLVIQVSSTITYMSSDNVSRTCSSAPTMTPNSKPMSCFLKS